MTSFHNTRQLVIILIILNIINPVPLVNIFIVISDLNLLALLGIPFSNIITTYINLADIYDPLFITLKGKLMAEEIGLFRSTFCGRVAARLCVSLVP